MLILQIMQIHALSVKWILQGNEAISESASKLAWLGIASTSETECHFNQFMQMRQCHSNVFPFSSLLFGSLTHFEGRKPQKASNLSR